MKIHFCSTVEESLFYYSRDMPKGYEDLKGWSKKTIVLLYVRVTKIIGLYMRVLRTVTSYA